MAATSVPAMASKPKAIMFSDFDGTITLKDSNDYLTDNIGYGEARRKAENQDTLNGKNTFRKSFEGMMASVTAPFDQCISMLVQNIKLDPGFKDFYIWALANNVPVVVLSSGMKPIIRALLDHLVGKDADKIEIVSNDITVKSGQKTVNEEDGWDLVFHDDSDFGHDKSLTIRPYANLPANERPVLFYAGDGVSDLSAARETDLLFAKEGKDLVTYCVRENMPFTTFKDWSEITKVVQDIHAGKKTVKDASQEGWDAYKNTHPAN